MWGVESTPNAFGDRECRISSLDMESISAYKIWDLPLNTSCSPTFKKKKKDIEKQLSITVLSKYKLSCLLFRNIIWKTFSSKVVLLGKRNPTLVVMLVGYKMQMQKEMVASSEPVQGLVYILDPHTTMNLFRSPRKQPCISSDYRQFQ